jgi:hypothetical protein
MSVLSRTTEGLNTSLGPIRAKCSNCFFSLLSEGLEESETIAQQVSAGQRCEKRRSIRWRRRVHTGARRGGWVESEARERSQSSPSGGEAGSTIIIVFLSFYLFFCLKTEKDFLKTVKHMRATLLRFYRPLSATALRRMCVLWKRKLARLPARSRKICVVKVRICCRISAIFGSQRAKDAIAS